MLLARDLRYSVLQYAMQGTLTKQLPEDSSVVTVLDSYFDGIKTDYNEDYLLEIPPVWKYVKLGDVLEVARGGSPRPISAYLTTSSNGVNWIKIGDTNKGGKYIESCKEKICPEGIKSSRFVQKGDFLLTNSMSFGRPYILNIDGCIHDGWLVFHDEYHIFNKDYLYYLLSSNLVYQQFLGRVSGGVVKNLNINKVCETIVPLPPIEEQQRIAEKLDDIMKEIDEYEAMEKTLVDIQKKFPDDMKKAVLQYAMQGKLTERNDTDSPIIDVLAHIRCAKAKMVQEGLIKKERTFPPITNQDIPFEIPETWKWVRWGEIAYSIQYGYNAPATTSGKIKMVRISDIQNNKVNWETVPFCEIKDEEIEMYLLKPNDILFARTGGTVGKSFLVESVDEKAIYAGYLIRTRYDERLVPKYLKFFMESQLYWIQLQNGKTQGCQPNCNGQTLAKMLIPLPPIEEQKRIVERLEQILPLIDDLKE